MIPKYVVVSTGDQFFTPDSSQLYFANLLGQKYLRYVPNTGHSEVYPAAVDDIRAFYSAVLEGTPLPSFSWTLEPDGSIRVVAADAPRW